MDDIYATLTDMLMDTNRLDIVSPTNPFFDRNIVGSGGVPGISTAVPEPATWALMLGGLALVGGGCAAVAN